MENVDQAQILKGARIYIIRSIIAPILMAILYFVSAGNFNNPRAWVYYTLFFFLSVIISWTLYAKNPELLFHRNRLKSDAKGWDKFLMPVAVLSGFHLQSIVMGLDERFGWSHGSSEFMGIGIVLYLLSFLFSTWAMFVNQHFEANVRIQKDRDHKVISKGPYKFIRHPGYLAFILGSVSAPLTIGSLFGLLNAGFGSILIIVRTAMEDHTLKNELAGYQEYSSKVKYRMIPAIW